MNAWRNGLIVVGLGVTLGGYGWMFASSDPALRASLALLSSAFLTGMGGVFWHYWDRLTPRLFTANLVLGGLVHLVGAALVVGGDRLGEVGVVPALANNGHHFLIGVLGIAAAYVVWTRARGSAEPAPVTHAAPGAEPEPAPAPSPRLDDEPNWQALRGAVADDGVRSAQLQALQRLATVLREGGQPTAQQLDQARRVVHQEAGRLAQQAQADKKRAEDDDVLSQAASLLEWGAQKLPELAELDASDLLMAKVIADIRSAADRIEHTFVPVSELRAIHPIDRATADAKCEQRAEAARRAMPLLQANGLRLSEALIAAEPSLEPFSSVTGFQVVSLGEGEGYVTFEGNGRREALVRALGEGASELQVEVRWFQFDDPDVQGTIARRVQRVRSWKKVED